MHRAGRQQQQQSYLGGKVLFRPGKRVTFWYRHERLHSPLQQEPVGAYVVAATEDQADGQITVRHPLILDWGAIRGKNNWATKLSAEYDAVRAKLTRVLLRKRIDAIVTIRRNRTYQIVLLRVPMTEAGEVDAKSLQAEEARKKKERLFPGPKPSKVEIPVEVRRIKTVSLPDFPGEVSLRLLQWTQKSVEELLEEVPPEVLKDQLLEERRWEEGELERHLAYLKGAKEEIATAPISNLQMIHNEIEYSRGEVAAARKRLREVDLHLFLLQNWNTYKNGGTYKAHYLSRKKQEAMAAKQVQAELGELLGPEATTKDLISLTGFDGLPEASKYQVELLPPKNARRDLLKVRIHGPHINQMQRTIYKDLNGRLIIHNDILKLKRNAPRGLGTRILYSQALAAQEKGVRALTCNASKQQGLVGYYVWARLGYNARLRDILGRDEVKALVDQGFFAHKGSRFAVSHLTVHDLMMTPEGRDWWEENGKEWVATFDLEPTPEGGPSSSMQVLETYIREKSTVLGKPIQKWAAGEDTEGISLSELDEEILDRVWDIMRERELRKQL